MQVVGSKDCGAARPAEAAPNIASDMKILIAPKTTPSPPRMALISLSKPPDARPIRMRLRVAHRILWFTREVYQLKQLIPIRAYCYKIHGRELLERFEI